MSIEELEQKHNIIIDINDGLFLVCDINHNLLFIASSLEQIEKEMLNSYRI